ncbi:hypothetical protein BKA64DRAFT_478927 [Cadophora sp. MPI-SDFR-AT-0126]|nr:hypothetical protein BKA64DRAFT_478927 [Leotiomycetes sp. MPI-SDFR-AT-0126]
MGTCSRHSLFGNSVTAVAVFTSCCLLLLVFGVSPVIAFAFFTSCHSLLSVFGVLPVRSLAFRFRLLLASTSSCDTWIWAVGGTKAGRIRRTRLMAQELPITSSSVLWCCSYGLH